MIMTLHILLKARNPIQYTMLYKRYHAPLQNLAHTLATDLKMKQIDLTLRHCSYFERPEILKIENYEVKQGHVLTYGVHDPTRLMPKWRAEDIPLFEGTWLFRNRGAGMLIPALYFMRDGGIPDEKKENFVIECGKAELAMGDCILLLRKKYHHLYSERLRCIDDLDVSDSPGAVELYWNITVKRWNKNCGLISRNFISVIWLSGGLRSSHFWIGSTASLSKRDWEANLETG